MTSIVTSISLLCLISVGCQELKLISELNSFFNFDHNVFVLDSSTDKSRFIDPKSNKEITPKSVYIFSKVDNTITGLETLTEINSKKTLMVVVVETSNFDSNINLLKRVKELQQLQSNTKIGWFFRHFSAMEDLKELFSWCKQHLIVNIFAAIYAQSDGKILEERQVNIFTFNPMGPFEVINVTVETLYNFFLNSKSNFKQQELRFGDVLRGASKAFWLTVFDRMNASYTVQRNTSVHSKVLLENGIDIIPLPHPQRDLGDFFMYPLELEPIIIIVPETPPYSEFSAYFRNVTSEFFFTFSLITIGGIVLLLCIIRYIKLKEIMFFRSAAEVVSLLMNNNSYIKYQRLSRKEVFIIVPLTFVGFVVVNGIFSHLQSYLTRPFPRPQINTIEDIYRSPFPILTYNTDWKVELVDVLTNSTKYNDWNDKVIEAAEPDFLLEQFYKYNKSISYLVSSQYANVLLRVQKNFKMNTYHNPNMKIILRHFAFPVNKKFLLFERLNDILHRIKSAGLWGLWVRRAFGTIEERIKKEYRDEFRNRVENVKHFKFPTFIVYGWIAGGIAFVIEILWKHLKCSWIRKLKRFVTDKFVH